MKKAIVMGCMSAFALAACVPPKPDNSSSDADSIIANADREANRLEAEADKLDSDANNIIGGAASGDAKGDSSSTWTYATSEDKMRGTSGRTASVSSTDTLSLGFPYGETTPELTIRQDPKFGFDIYFTSEGQPQCDEYSHPRISVKFDGEAVREWGCNRAADGSPGIVFFSSEKTLLEKLKTAKVMMVEVDYYNAGRQQFSFPVAGLKWE